MVQRGYSLTGGNEGRTAREMAESLFNYSISDVTSIRLMIDF